MTLSKATRLLCNGDHAIGGPRPASRVSRLGPGVADPGRATRRPPPSMPETARGIVLESRTQALRDIERFLTAGKLSGLRQHGGLNGTAAFQRGVL